jgi:diguanylate cyclase (GGDEF)-like protein
MHRPSSFSQRGRSRLTSALLGSTSLALIGLADYLTGPEIAFSLFYIVVIALMAWTTADVGLSVASALLGACIWLAAEWFAGSTSTDVVMLWNAATRLVIFIGAGVLICRLRRALDLARTLARTDYVTDVLHARAFDEIAKIEVSRARRYSHALTVAYLDLDNFKSVNDRFGHSQGDDVLRTVASTLRSSLRTSDTVARLGGDEFVVMLPETGYGQAQEALTKLQQSLTEAMQQRRYPVTFSIGAAIFEVPPADVDALIKAADSAMYKAKADGKNRCSLSVERPAVAPPRDWRVRPPAI